MDSDSHYVQKLVLTLLNQVPQFETEVEIEGFEVLDIHFVHQKSDVEGAIPLLFVHGCKCNPSSLPSIFLWIFRVLRNHLLC